jgi:hypothetical protein
MATDIGQLRMSHSAWKVAKFAAWNQSTAGVGTDLWQHGLSGVTEAVNQGVITRTDDGRAVLTELGHTLAKHMGWLF